MFRRLISFLSIAGTFRSYHYLFLDSCLCVLQNGEKHLSLHTKETLITFIMEIKINSLDNIREAAKQFIAAMEDNTVFAFYGKMGFTDAFATRFVPLSKRE